MPFFIFASAQEVRLSIWQKGGAAQRQGRCIFGRTGRIDGDGGQLRKNDTRGFRHHFARSVMKENRGRSGFSGHPLHPLFTHFPMALWIISLLWDLLGLWRGDPLWWSFSFWSIAVGLIFAFLAVVTGLIDFVKIPQGGPAEGVAMRHMMMVMAAAVLYAGSFFARLGSPIPSGMRLFIALALSFLGFVLLLIGGWYGGELVYRYGIGRSNNKEEF